jgi:hypothetical protein
VDRSHVKPLRAAVEAAQRFAHTNTLSGCDADDIDEVVAVLEREFDRPLPNTQTVSTYVHSLARSLRSQRHAGEILQRLESAMSEAGVPLEL